MITFAISQIQNKDRTLHLKILKKIIQFTLSLLLIKASSIAIKIISESVKMLEKQSLVNSHLHNIKKIPLLELPLNQIVSSQVPQNLIAHTNLNKKID